MIKNVLGNAISDKQASQWAKQYYRELLSGIKNVAKEQEKINLDNQVRQEKEILRVKKEQFEYEQKRKQYLDEGSKQEEEYKNQQALIQAYSDADEYLKRENDYLKLRNQYIAEGVKQEKNAARMYNQEAAEADKLVGTMERVRAGSEMAAKAEEKRQLLSQNKAINKALSDEYVAVDKINKTIASGANEAKIESLNASFRGLGISTEGIQKELLGVNGALKSLGDSSDGKTLISNAKSLEIEYSRVENRIKELTAAQKGFATESKKISVANNISNWADNNTKAIKNNKAQIDSWISTLRSADNLTVPELQKIETEFKKIQLVAREAGTIGKTWGNSIADMGKKFVSWGAASGAIMLTVQRIKESVVELKNINTILTEISKTNDSLSKTDLMNLGRDSFSIASKYGKNASDYLLGVQEASRAGYSDAEGIAELSTLAQSAGDMTAELANQYLIATDSAYKLQGQTEELNAVLDGQNEITNRNAVNMSDLAEATKVAASQAQSSQIPINEMTAAVGTMIATTQQGGDVAGRAFKAILMNLQQVSGVVDEETGEIIDADQLTKYEKAADRLGVKLKEVKDGYVSLRNPMDILRDLSKAYTSLPSDDSRRASLINAVGGKERGNQLNAILENWDKYEKMLSDYSEGSGSAMEEAMKSANNWDGSLNRLSNTITEITENFVKSDSVIGGLNGLNNFLQGINTITKTLGGLGTVGAIGGGILGTKGLGIESLKKDLYEITPEIESAFDKISNASSGTNWNDFINQNKIADETLKKFLNDANQTDKSLEAFKQYPDVVNKTGKAFNFAAMGAKALSIAMNAAIMFAIVKAIELVANAVDRYINRVEYAKEAMSNARENFESVKSELEGINSELESNKARISELNGLPSLSYVEQGELDKLKEATKELERQRDIKNIELKRSAEKLSETNRKAFNKEYGDNDFSLNDVNQLASTGSPSMTLAQNGLEGLAAAIVKVRDAKKEAESIDDTEWIENMVSAEGEYKKQLEGNLSALQGYRDNLTEILNYRSLTKDEQSFYDNLEQGIRLIYQFTDPSAWNQIEFDQIFNDESLDITKEKLIELAQAGKLDEDSIKQYSKLNDVIDQTDLILDDGETSVQSFIKQIIALGDESKTTGDIVKESFSKEDVISNINSLSEGFESLDKIMSSMKDKNPFDYALLDDKNFKDQFSGLGEVYTDFIEKVSSSPKDIKANQSAFDDLVTVWVNSSDALTNLTDENANLTTAMLKNMGVANAEEVVTNRLQIAHEKLAAEKYYNENASDDLANSTVSEIDAFVNEGVAAGVSQQAISQLALEKLSVNNIKIDTASDIDQVIALANAAGASTSALDQLARAKSAFASINSAIAKGTAQLANPSMGSPIAAGLTLANEMLNSNTMQQISEAQKTLEDIENGTYDFGVTLNPDNFKKATYGGGTKTNKAGGPGNEKSKKDYSEVFDWVATTIDRVDEKVEALQNKISDVSNWKSKNALTNTTIDEMSNKLAALQSQADTYQGKADSYDLSPTYIDKIKNGTLEIETITDEVVGNNIKSYQEWYNKAEDVRKQIDETKKSMQELAKSRIDNIINDFNSLVSLMDKYSSYNENLISLQKELGEDISSTDYENLINQQEAIYNQLQSKYNNLSSELAKAVSSGTIKIGEEEWRKYQEELIGVNSEMNDTVSSMNDFRKAMIDLPFEELERLSSTFDRMNNGISTMSDLIGDDGLLDGGMLTSRGLAKIALLGEQYANAKQQAADYAEAINAVNEMYENGSLTQDEYNEKLNDYTNSQLSAVKATKEAEQAILQFRYDAIQAQIDDMNDLISAKKEALQTEKDYQDYLESIAEKQTDINNLQAKIDELSLSTSRQDIAQRLQLEQQLSDAKKELSDSQADYAYDKTLEGLDKQASDYEEAKNKELEELKSNTDAQQKVIKDYLGQVKDNYKTVYNTLTQYGTDYNVTMTDELTSPWESANSAVSTFQDAVGDAISQINIDIASIDLSKLTEMVSTMQGFSATGSGSSFEDITGTGTWHKNKTGDWYGTSDDDYASDGIYTIGGKQYNFNEDGYMKSGWDDSTDQWRYFDPENGQMVKSTWRKGADGKDYYLKSDGTMATDMAIKSKSENGYYYVNDDGVWDGQTLSSDEVKQRKITVGYTNGTTNSKSGLKYVNENGPELIVTKDGTVLNSVGGDTVFPNDMVKKLWELGNNPERFMIDSVSKNIPSYDLSSLRNVNKNEPITLQLNSPLMTVNNTDERTMGLLNNRLNTFATKELPEIMRKDMKGR